MSNRAIRAVALYGGFAAWMALSVAFASQALCLSGVAWITGGSSLFARDVARWSRGASLGLGLNLDEDALFWIARVGGAVVGVLALGLVVRRVA